MSRPRRTHCPCGVELSDENRAMNKSKGTSRGLCLVCDAAYMAEYRRNRKRPSRRKYTPSEIGQMGGGACLARHGRGHYAAMGRKAAEKRRET